MIFGIFLLPALCLSHCSNNKRKPFKFDKNSINRHVNRKIAHNGYSEPPFENDDFKNEFKVVGFIIAGIGVIIFIVVIIIIIYRVCCRKKNKDKNIVAHSPLINQNNDSYHNAISPTIPQQPYHQYTVYNQDVYQQTYPQIYQKQYQQPQQPYIQSNMMMYPQPYEQSYQQYNPQYIPQNISNNSV